MATLDIRHSVPLASYTTLKVGGAARYLVEVTSGDALSEAVAFAEERGLPFLCVGGGSNLLCADAGYEGVVIVMRITGRDYEAQPDGTVCARFGAGEVFDEVVADTVARGWWGLENLSHIPGTVGATPVQNVGAYGVEMSDVITAVEVFDTATGAARTLSPAECSFGYRDSMFKSAAGAALIVTQVECRLQLRPQPRLEYADLASLASLATATTALTPAAVRAKVMAIRAQKFPDWTTVGTAGSFFTNPIIPRAQAEALLARYPELPVHAVSATHVKVALGYVLDKICHLKGYERGHVALSAAQALVLIAQEGATADEILDFAAEVATRVFDATGITITREVTYVSTEK